MIDAILGMRDLVALCVSVAALGLGVLTLVSTKKREARELRLDTERHLDKVWDLLFGQHGHSETGDTANLREASEAVARALVVDPENVRALQYEGLIHDLQGDRAGATSSLRKALAQDKRNSKTWNWLGLAIGATDAAEAANCFRRAIDLCPEDSASAHFNLARFLGRLGDLAEAHSHFEEAARIRPRDSDVLVGLARSQRSLARWEEARRTYERAISAGSSNLEAMIELGAMVAEREEWEKGLAWILEAKRLDPTDSYASTTLAVLYSRKGDSAEATRYYEEAVSIDPRLRLLGSDFSKLKERIEEEKELAFPEPAEQSIGPEIATQIKSPEVPTYVTG